MFETYPDVLTVAEVREMLKIGRKTVYGMIAEGILDARRIGRQYRISKASVERFMTRK